MKTQFKSKLQSRSTLLAVVLAFVSWQTAVFKRVEFTSRGICG